MKKVGLLINHNCSDELLAFAVIAEAQQPKKVPRIGYLSSIRSQLVSPPVPRQFGWLLCGCQVTNTRMLF